MSQALIEAQAESGELALSENGTRFDPPYEEIPEQAWRTYVLKDFVLRQDSWTKHGTGAFHFYSDIRISSVELEKLIPDAARPVSDEILSSTHTGDPGRPSAAQLYLNEFERRCKTGNIEETLAAQAHILLKWLETEHPSISRSTVKTIENRIRPLYKKAKKTP
ncbi:MAG: hypothetical protein V1721_07585 [Pseudomonadota bacterium]